MKTMSSAEVRRAFLDFFARRGHTIVPSASLVPADDPSLLFTNAGMNQFKDVFLGGGTRPYARAADTQKCMRVSGKHNDLEDVGKDGTHHTFFEMLGNWSFGDYYKKEAITWAWQFLSEVVELDPARIWATVFKDDDGELEADEEAAGFWRSETTLGAGHVLYFGREDNFWAMADTGPCGPCSEIHYDLGPEHCQRQGEENHACQVNGDCGRFVELWNLVFIQYNKDAEGALQPLPAKHVDTGMGFERLAALLQGVDSNYKTDLFLPITRRVQELTGQNDPVPPEDEVAYRVIADHARAVTFLIGDGVLPGNEGRNYVLRMILRRAARFGRKIGLDEPFLSEIAEVVIGIMGAHYPELENRRDFILTTVNQEEERFLRTLDHGLSRLDEILSRLVLADQSMVPGEDAFRLYDTFGLPLEITRDVAEERGLQVDEAGFRSSLQEQRLRARRGDAFEALDGGARARYQEILDTLRQKGLLGEAGVVMHDPYSSTEKEAVVAGLLRDGELIDSADERESIEVVLTESSFYVESGGQVSDTGFVASYGHDDEPVWQLEITSVRQPVAGLIVHEATVRKGTARTGDPAWAVVDYERRMDIARNHTATHILHSELRYVLGPHVQQAGSLVAADRLRFDFTHPTMLTQEELDAVTRSVNDAILANYPLEVNEETYKEALEHGATALFGEKYGEDVRVVRMGLPGEPFSQELCGGTHVHETGEIGHFVILAESGVGAGVRRIEAATGRSAVDYMIRQSSVLRNASAYLGVSPGKVDRRVLSLLGELQTCNREMERLEKETARRELEQLLSRVVDVGGVALLSARVGASSDTVLRDMTDWFRDRIQSGVVVLGAIIDRRPVIVAAATEDLVPLGVDASKLVKAVARVVGGGGGGKATMARAGGRDPARLDEALASAAGLLKDLLGASS
jgi:alanyl-tRNA synthetase